MQGEEPNPGPLRELAYWDARAARLNSLHDQLSSEKLKKVAKILELARSSYYPAITRWAYPDLRHYLREWRNGERVRS